MNWRAEQLRCPRIDAGLDHHRRCMDRSGEQRGVGRARCSSDRINSSGVQSPPLLRPPELPGSQSFAGVDSLAFPRPELHLTGSAGGVPSANAGTASPMVKAPAMATPTSPLRVVALMNPPLFWLWMRTTTSAPPAVNWCFAPAERCRPSSPGVAGVRTAARCPLDHRAGSAQLPNSNKRFPLSFGCSGRHGISPHEIPASQTCLPHSGVRVQPETRFRRAVMVGRATR